MDVTDIIAALVWLQEENFGSFFEPQKQIRQVVSKIFRPNLALEKEDVFGNEDLMGKIFSYLDARSLPLVNKLSCKIINRLYVDRLKDYCGIKAYFSLLEKTEQTYLKEFVNGLTLDKISRVAIALCRDKVRFLEGERKKIEDKNLQELFPRMLQKMPFSVQVEWWFQPSTHKVDGMRQFLYAHKEECARIENIDLYDCKLTEVPREFSLITPGQGVTLSDDLISVFNFNEQPRSRVRGGGDGALLH